MGNSGLAHQFGTFSSVEDDLHTGGILQVVHTRDRPVAWSVSLYHIGSGSQVYDPYLGEFLESHRDAVDDEHCFSSIDKRSVREDHSDFREHAMDMRPGS